MQWSQAVQAALVELLDMKGPLAKQNMARGTRHLKTWTREKSPYSAFFCAAPWREVRCHLPQHRGVFQWSARVHLLRTSGLSPEKRRNLTALNDDTARITNTHLHLEQTDENSVLSELEEIEFLILSTHVAAFFKNNLTESKCAHHAHNKAKRGKAHLDYRFDNKGFKQLAGSTNLVKSCFSCAPLVSPLALFVVVLEPSESTAC